MKKPKAPKAPSEAMVEKKPSSDVPGIHIHLYGSGREEEEDQSTPIIGEQDDDMEIDKAPVRSMSDLKKIRAAVMMKKAKRGK